MRIMNNLIPSHIVFGFLKSQIAESYVGENYIYTLRKEIFYGIRILISKCACIIDSFSFLLFLFFWFSLKDGVLKICSTM